MNARVKRVATAPAQEAAEGENDWIVVGVVKRPIWGLDGKREGWSRWIVWDRANKDLPRQAEAAWECKEINKRIKSQRYQTY